jgi:hypothetical protein
LQAFQDAVSGIFDDPSTALYGALDGIANLIPLTVNEILTLPCRLRDPGAKLESGFGSPEESRGSSRGKPAEEIRMPIVFHDASTGIVAIGDPTNVTVVIDDGAAACAMRTALL